MAAQKGEAGTGQSSTGADKVRSSIHLHPGPVRGSSWDARSAATAYYPAGPIEIARSGAQRPLVYDEGQ